MAKFTEMVSYERLNNGLIEKRTVRYFSPEGDWAGRSNESTEIISDYPDDVKVMMRTDAYRASVAASLRALEVRRRG